MSWPTYLKIVDFVEYSPARSESFVNLCFIILTVTSEKLWFEIQRQAMILYLTKYLLRKELLKSFTYCWTHFPMKSLSSIFLLFICSWEWNRSRQLGYSSLVTWWGVWSFFSIIFIIDFLFYYIFLINFLFCHMVRSKIYFEITSSLTWRVVKIIQQWIYSSLWWVWDFCRFTAWLCM